MKIVTRLALCITVVISTAVLNSSIYPTVLIHCLYLFYVNSQLTNVFDCRHYNVGSGRTTAKFKKYSDSLAECGSDR